MLRLPFIGDYPLSQEFGANPDYYKQFQVKWPDGSTRPMGGHNGRDYALPSGTDIVAPHDGEIIEAAFDANGYGNYIKIENDVEGSVLAHLESFSVQVGFLVKVGDKIGKSDNTGYSTGPHLHWGWYKKPRNRANGFGGFEDQASEIQADTPIPSVAASGKLYTSEEYNACMIDRQKFWGERDAALSKLDALQHIYDTDMAAYSAMRALGYNSVDDINKKLKGLEDENTELKKENIAILKRNETLAGVIQDSEKESHTTAEAGLNALFENDKLKQDMARVAQVTGTDPKGVVDRIILFREMGEKFLQKLAGEHKNKEEQQQKKADDKKNEAPKISGIQSLLANLFLGGVN